MATLPNREIEKETCEEWMEKEEGKKLSMQTPYAMPPSLQKYGFPVMGEKKIMERCAEQEQGRGRNL